MRVTFIRFPDHRRAYVRVERDDGVVYRLDSGPASPRMPHDLVHYTVEDTLEIEYGIWGAIAGGVVFRSMSHESGRRPPHAASRSKELIREYRDQIQRAELIGGLCENAAFHGVEPIERFERLDTVTAALHRAQSAWSRLEVGGQLVLEWPAWRTVTKLKTTVTKLKTPARTERPGRSRSRRGRSSG